MRAKGLEPIRLTAPDPKSGLATNYNTPASFPFRPYFMPGSEQVCKDRYKNLKNKTYFRQQAADAGSGYYFLNWAQHHLSMQSDFRNSRPDCAAIPEIIGRSSS